MNKIYSDKVRLQAIKYRTRGWTFKSIAERFGCSASLVHYWVTINKRAKNIVALTKLYQDSTLDC